MPAWGDFDDLRRRFRRVGDKARERNPFGPRRMNGGPDLLAKHSAKKGLAWRRHYHQRVRAGKEPPKDGSSGEVTFTNRVASSYDRRVIVANGFADFDLSRPVRPPPENLFIEAYWIVPENSDCPGEILGAKFLG